VGTSLLGTRWRRDHQRKQDGEGNCRKPHGLVQVEVSQSRDTFVPRAAARLLLATLGRAGSSDEATILRLFPHTSFKTNMPPTRTATSIAKPNFVQMSLLFAMRDRTPKAALKAKSDPTA
jgi:hypothetical protein